MAVILDAGRRFVRWGGVAGAAERNGGAGRARAAGPAGPAEGGAGPDGLGTAIGRMGAASGGGTPRSAETVGTVPEPWSRTVTLLVRATGVAAVLGIAVDVWLGLAVTPPAKVMGNLVRLLYVHPALATVALYLAFGLAALNSLLWLWPRTRRPFFDRLAAASVQTGIVFLVLTIVTGSLWGRPTWGVFWTWDPLLTFTALLLLFFLGYLAVRKATTDPVKRARRAAVTCLLAFIDVPVVHFSVIWWRTLHQTPTLLEPASPKVGGIMLATMLLSFLAFTLLFVWMLAYGYRLRVLKDFAESSEVAAALAERTGEAEQEEMGWGMRPGQIERASERLLVGIAEPAVRVGDDKPVAQSAEGRPAHPPGEAVLVDASRMGGGQ